ncbi:MAG TPA: hypothetical protein VI296_07465 [Candidatus Dormibacteraeota bacterium]
MTLSTRALKAFSGMGAVALCGVSGVLVATDPKPAAAPLRPPVSGSSSSASALVIPPSCFGSGVATGGGAGSGATATGGSIASSVVEAPASTQPLISTYVS